MTEIKPVVAEENGVADAAMLIAGPVYGGVVPGSDQWEKCKAAAQLVLDSDLARTRPRLIGRIGAAEAAHERAKKWNAKHPNGTWGFIKNIDGQAVLVRVESQAVVYPDPFNGEVPMAWFYPVGWKPIGEFQPKHQSAEQNANELMQYGEQLKAQQRDDLAQYMYYAAVVADPGCWQAYNHLGVVCHQQGRHLEAIGHFTKGLSVQPQAYELFNNRSLARRATGDYVGALADCDETIRLNPDIDLFVINRASILDDLGRADEAIAILDAYVARRPDKPSVAHNRSLILLNNGRFAAGWRAYESRLRAPSANAHYEHCDIPRWEPGVEIAGKEILVWTEQGVGDEILTASMALDLARIAKVTLLCSPRLQPLLSRSFGDVINVHVRASLLHLEMFKRERLTDEYLPSIVKTSRFDYQMSQGDLGELLRPDFDAFPGTPFLKADHLEAMVACALIENPDNLPLVGIAWHSNRNHNLGSFKGVGLKQLAPILKIPGVKFVCLQYGDCAAEIASAEAEFGVKIAPSPVDQIESIDDFAALVSCMALVITVSNTTAHIAGALGVPTWVMVPDGPGRLWYWWKTGTKCRWYNSVKLFRQQCSLQWDAVIDRVAASLAAWVSEQRQ